MDPVQVEGSRQTSVPPTFESSSSSSEEEDSEEEDSKRWPFLVNQISSIKGRKSYGRDSD